LIEEKKTAHTEGKRGSWERGATSAGERMGEKAIRVEIEGGGSPISRPEKLIGRSRELKTGEIRKQALKAG